MVSIAALVFHPRSGRQAACLLAAIVACGLSACAPQQPEGQVVALIDGEPVTQRELQAEQAAGARTDGGDRGDDALARLVARKALVQEAESLGLERDARFHFALRRAREELLVESLREHLASELKPQAAGQINHIMSQSPWRYSQRFLLRLVPTAGAASGTDDYRYDSASSLERPSAEWLSAAPGDVVTVDGKTMRVAERVSPQETPAALRARAEDDVLAEIVERELRRKVMEYRQNGKIRYQEGTRAVSELER